MLQLSFRLALLTAISGVVNIAHASDNSAELQQTNDTAAYGWCISDQSANDANQECTPNVPGEVSEFQDTQSDLPLLLAQATTEQAQDQAEAIQEENADLTLSSPESTNEQSETAPGETDAAASGISASSLIQRLRGKLENLSQGMLAALLLSVTLPIVLLLALTTRFFGSREAAIEEAAYYRNYNDRYGHDELPLPDSLAGSELFADAYQEEDEAQAYENPDEAIYESDSLNPAEADIETLESLDLIDQVFDDSSEQVHHGDDKQPPQEIAKASRTQLYPDAQNESAESQINYDDFADESLADPYEKQQSDNNGQNSDIFGLDASHELDNLSSIEQTSDIVDSLYDDFNQTYIEEVPAYHIDLQPETAKTPNDAISDNQIAQSRKKQLVDREKAIHSAHWLSREPMENQKDYVIDYLVYWMAHADKRFAPAAEKKVLQMKNPGTRDLIKRDVFLNNAYAYSMVINIVRTQLTLAQRKQILDLLMALLVVEHALTPIQNNLLRFLADAFGIGASGIKSQFEKAFGYSMPSIPRPDKLIWWKQINNEHTLRWNARAIARLPEQVRDRILLGQSLDGEIRAASVIQSFKLAEERCHPECVDKLGERAQALLKSRSQKFATARDNLLETIA